MKRHTSLLLVAAVVSVGALAITGTNALAGGDPGDGIVPGALNVTATNSTNISFKGTIGGLRFTATCTASTYKFITPAAGTGPTNMPVQPTFAGCRDSLGGADSVTARGQWVWEELDAPGEPEPSVEPNAVGDQIELTIPIGGMTFSTSVLPGCIVTAAPAAAAGIPGAFNEVALTHTYANTAFAVAGAGCVAAGFSISGTYTMNKAFNDT